MRAILRAQYQVMRNVIAQMTPFEKTSLGMACLLMIYLTVAQAGLTMATIDRVRDIDDEGLWMIVLLVLTIAYLVPLLGGVLYGGRYMDVLPLIRPNHLPMSRNQLVLLSIVRECIDPFVVITTALLAAGAVGAKDHAPLVLTASVCALCFSLVVGTRVLLRLSIERAGRLRPLVTILWILCCVLLLLGTVATVREALLPDSGAGAAPGYGLRFAPPWWMTTVFMSGRKGVIDPLPLVITAVFVITVVLMTRRCTFLEHGNSASSVGRLRGLRVEHVDSMLRLMLRSHYTSLMSKDIVYYFRGNRTRLAFLSGLVIYFMMNLDQAHGESPPSIGWQFATIVLAVMTTVVMGGNTFGNEGSGILRYVIVPEETRTILASKRDSSMAVGLLAFSMTLLLPVMLGRLGTWSVVTLLLCIPPTLALSVTWGIVLSLLFPMKVDFDAMMRQAMPVHSAALFLGFTLAVVAPVVCLAECLPQGVSIEFLLLLVAYVGLQWTTVFIAAPWLVRMCAKRIDRLVAVIK